MKKSVDTKNPKEVFNSLPVKEGSNKKNAITVDTQFIYLTSQLGLIVGVDENTIFEFMSKIDSTQYTDKGMQELLRCFEQDFSQLQVKQKLPTLTEEQVELILRILEDNVFQKIVIQSRIAFENSVAFDQIASKKYPGNQSFKSFISSNYVVPMHFFPEEGRYSKCIIFYLKTLIEFSENNKKESWVKKIESSVNSLRLNYKNTEEKYQKLKTDKEKVAFFDELFKFNEKYEKLAQPSKKNLDILFFMLFIALVVSPLVLAVGAGVGLTAVSLGLIPALMLTTTAGVATIAVLGVTAMASLSNSFLFLATGVTFLLFNALNKNNTKPKEPKKIGLFTHLQKFRREDKEPRYTLLPKKNFF